MKHITSFKIITLLAVLFIMPKFNYAQEPTNMSAEQNPMTIAKTVADRIIEVTPFEFQLTVLPCGTLFDYVKFVDFGRTFGTGQPAVAYAISNIDSPVPQELTFQISHNDGAKIWVNGEVVYSKTGNRDPSFEAGERHLKFENEFKVNLKKGANQILIKSESRGGDEWIVYLQPEKARSDEAMKNAPKLTLANIENISMDVVKLTNWLVMGTFANEEVDGRRQGLGTEYPPEKEFEIGKTYTSGEKKITWTIPKIEIFADVIGGHPLWGSYYNWNYHTGALAWAMGQLGHKTETAKYKEFCWDYADFHVETKPFVEFQVKELNGFESVNHEMVQSLLLDYTLAPSVPFVYRLIHDEGFPKESQYKEWVKDMTYYGLEKQSRSRESNFNRFTPKKYTTWTDDMFKGLPYLLLAAKNTTNAQDRKKLFDDVARQIIAFNKRTWDEKVNLYHHAQYSYKQVNMPYWGRANGWGLWAVSEALLHLPDKHPKYDQLEEHFVKHVNALVMLQDNETGLWRNILDSPTSRLETSASAMITMAIARGINQGWLSKRKYEAYATKGWDGLKTVIMSDGTVKNICVEAFCSEKAEYYQELPFVDNDSHGMSAIILAALEMNELVN